MVSPNEQLEHLDIGAVLGDEWTLERPLYVGLAGALRAAIIRGEIPTGARLPAERALSNSLKVSRSTVVAAYGALREERWVRSLRGSGTYALVGNRVPLIGST